MPIEPHRVQKTLGSRWHRVACARVDRRERRRGQGGGRGAGWRRRLAAAEHRLVYYEEANGLKVAESRGAAMTRWRRRVGRRRHSRARMRRVKCKRAPRDAERRIQRAPMSHVHSFPKCLHGFCSYGGKQRCATSAPIVRTLDSLFDELSLVLFVCLFVFFFSYA